MSDKETTPWMREAAKEILRESGDIYEDDVDDIAQIIAKHAVECTAQAPTQRGDSIVGRTADEPHRPLVCFVCANRFPVTFNFCLEHKDEYERLKARATPQGTPTLELERETDGRWIAEFPQFPGVMAYGATKEEAKRKGLKLLIETTARVHCRVCGSDDPVCLCDASQGTPDTQWIKPKFPATTPGEWREFGKMHFQENAPQGTPMTDPFSKGYKHREGKPVSDACGDGKHSECTQDLTKCHCTFRTGHTVLHAYMNPKLGQSAPSECPQCGSKDFWTVMYPNEKT